MNGETRQEELGVDAQTIALRSFDGKLFRYVGMKNNMLPHDHKYRIGNINYSTNTEHSIATLVVKDKTDGRVLENVRLDTLNFFREILR
jgi:hypothetical protein